MTNYRARVDFGELTWEPELTERELKELEKHKTDCHYAVWLRGSDRSYRGVCTCDAAQAEPKGRTVKVSKELSRILKAAAKEVSKWPKWKRSLDPYGAKK